MSTARTPDGAPRPMRFAYADPPYPGCAHLYRDHPDYAGEVDHLELITRLEADYPDGWALSTGGPQIKQVLDLCPADVRVAIWHRIGCYPPRGTNPGWWWEWEPVIVHGGRPAPVRTVLECGPTGNRQIIGGKPPAFTRWMLGLLGASPADTIDDLFPGSGAVGRVIESWRKQPILPVFTRSELQHLARHPERTARDMRLQGQPMLEQISEPFPAAQETLL